jgi:hypothetical protein
MEYRAHPFINLRKILPQTGSQFNFFCEAAVRVKRFLYAILSLPRHTSSVERVSCQPSVRAHSWASLCLARRIVGFGGEGGTICITALDYCQVIFRARRALL